MKKYFLIWTLVVALAVTSFGNSAMGDGEENEFLVLFNGNNINEAAVAEMEAMGAEVLQEAPQVGLAYVKGGTKEQMESIKGVAHVAENIEIETSELALEADEDVMPREEDTEADLFEQYQWDIKRVTGDGAAWDITKGSHSVVVAVIDTGVDFTHPDLQDNLLYGKTFHPDTTEEDAYRDSGTHGTHVAGSIAANGRVMGVGPELGLASYRVTNNQGRMNWTGILNAITTAADDGADVANLSLGTYSFINEEQDRLLHLSSKRAVQYAHRKGMIIVGANGNNGIDLGKAVETEKGEGKIYGPLFDTFTDIPGVVSVSATTDRDTLAYYSNYGSSNVNLAAPGGDYGPNWPNEDGDQSLLEPESRAYSTIPVNRGSYGWAMGTSMAAPKVAAAAALVKAENPSFSRARVITHLQQTADDLGKKGHDEFFGHGLVDAYEALK
ncbi:S8 family serine peptidase [Bacillus sp. H-16]|uniref:S8 family serine peptidase n=1 Tax=Alteribacter salitolerans TaxID=2912333 RepID=UPI0019655D80|nr:S8 family serine peptidase [Alteribacter salitolerans]